MIKWLSVLATAYAIGVAKHVINVGGDVVSDNPSSSWSSPRQSFWLFPAVTALQPYDYLRIYNDQKRTDDRRRRQRRHDQSWSRSGIDGHGNMNGGNVHGHDDVQELYITQKLDHFDPLSTATYQQRYFVSYRYAAGTDVDQSLNSSSGDGIIETTAESRRRHQRRSTMATTVINFLCVGGEGPGFDRSVLVDSVHCTGDMLELASKIMADTTIRNHVQIHLYALEHRYYGKSYPVFETNTTMSESTDSRSSPVTLEHLKFLSSRQALEDLAHFIRTMNDEITSSSGGVSDNGDVDDVLWVTFGGSYPGYMALNARYKYPHLVHAAVSSSAPLQLEVDFPGYKARQGWDLKYPKVGGSQECYRIVKTGHDQAVSLLTMPGRNSKNTNQTGAKLLAEKFNVCDPDSALLETRNAQLLLGDGLINIPAQSNDPSCSDDELCNIAGLCRFMEDTFKQKVTEYSKNNNHDDDPLVMAELDVLAKVAKHQRSSRNRILDGEDSGDDDDDCMTVDFHDMLAELSKPIVEPFGWRSWLWQTCTEVGFYQTCLEHTDCPFGTNYHTVDMDLEICETVFALSPSQVYENIQATLDHYGGLNIDQASRVLSVNGNVDPWSVLALQTSPKYSLPVAWADGSSHHFWTHAVKATDTPEVVQVRNYIHSVVIDWLGLSKNGSTTKTNIHHSVAKNHSNHTNSPGMPLLRGG